MDQVNTALEGISNPTQESMYQPTLEGSSNPTPGSLLLNDSTHDGQEDADSTEPPAKKQKSKVWKDFDRVTVDGVVKAICKWCRRHLSGNSTNGTTHLRKHAEKCVQKQIKTRGHNKGQTFIMPKAIQGKQEIGFGNYDAENTKKLIANAIIMHDYPLSIVDHIGFRRILGSLQPLFLVPSRNTIKKEILKVYDIERKYTMNMLDTHEGRVAITTDMWTASNQKRGYMAVTVHYIDGTWTLQSRVLRFIYVPAPHTSERLCKVLVECLIDWNIDSKLSTITLDNCATNDKMIDLVKNKLQLESLMRDGSLLHMRCSAHILNLIVKEGLQVVKDGIEKIRDSVAFWNGTPKRHEKFEEGARQLKISCTRGLANDVPTRWNSTFKMLESAIPYKDVFVRLAQREKLYTCLPSNTQWQFAKDVCGCLGLFNEITELVSGTKYPSASLCFPKICKIKLEIIKWQNSSNELIKGMADKMMGKFESYWSVIHDVMAVATVLDPRNKMVLLQFYFAKLYGIDSGAQVQRIRVLCYDLLSDYQSKKYSSESSPLIDTNVAHDDPLVEEWESYVEKEEEASSSIVKSELDHYLCEKILKKPPPDFDILNWWKANGILYPTLQTIAKDVLAIPISLVASESAISTSGRILSPHRSRLHWTTVEALMWARSWLWSNENDGNLNSGVAQDYATVLNEMGSDVEAEIMDGLSYRFDDE